MTEEWRDIPGYEGHYQASSLGRIRSLDRSVCDPAGRCRRKAGGVKAPQPHNKGYLMMHLYLGTRRQKVFVHRVIALTFLPNPYQHPIVNHKDRDRTNNALENLEWCDSSENQLHWRRSEALRQDLAIEVAAVAEGDLPW